MLLLDKLAYVFEEVAQLDEEKLERAMKEIREMVWDRMKQACSREIGDKARRVLDPLVRHDKCDPEPWPCYSSDKLRVDKHHGLSIRIEWDGREVYNESDDLDKTVICYIPGDEWEAALDQAVEEAPLRMLLQHALNWGLDPEQALRHLDE